ncbi:hypothetical protein EV182_003002, partial [Spiromyces aspiralis]
TSLLMLDCLYYLNIRTSNPTITPDTPIAQINEAADPPDVFKEKCRAFMGELKQQVRKTNALIEALPDEESRVGGDSGNDEDWETLNQEDIKVTQELEETSEKARK